MHIRRINAETVTVPTTGYSQALEVSGHTRLLFVSGQIPLGIDGTVPEGFEAQCRLAWRNVEAQLKAAGMTLDNLVMHRTLPTGATLFSIAPCETRYLVDGKPRSRWLSLVSSTRRGFSKSRPWLRADRYETNAPRSEPVVRTCAAKPEPSLK